MSSESIATSSATQTPAQPILRVYNTLTKKKEIFEPVNPGRVGIYLCGPTVYDRAHIGHMVGPVIFDAIKRYLVYCGYQVTWVVNITDVDDKLINKARQRGISMAKVAEENTADYLANLAGLGVDQIDHMPKATESMAEIIGFVQDLVDKKYAYESGGDVFFDVAKDPNYGKLSNRSADSQQGEGGGAAAKKRSAGDFALWKAAKPGEPSWDSPWGPGRPGWHIECSAMSHGLLGETFDIHGGGLDLVFPHHENEIAQSECCHGKPMVKYWMHNGLMRASAAGKIGGRAEREQDEATIETKISRSKGAGGLAELIAEQGGQNIRFFLWRTHYRSTIVYGPEGLEEARTSLQSFTRFFERFERITGESFYALTPIAKRSDGELPADENPLLSEVARHRAAYLAKMDDDFNTGAAISELFELLRVLNKFVDQNQLEDPAARDNAHLAAFRRGALTLRELTAVLGLFCEAPSNVPEADDRLVGPLLDLLVQLRTEARGRKDFATADQIRDRLGQLGVTLEDRKDGTAWRLQ
jgi:cysteinyl-tRNA synthetase